MMLLEPRGLRRPALAVLLLAFRPASGAPEESKEWHRLLLNGKPAGYTRQSEKELPGGSLKTHTFQRLVVRRAEQTVEMEMEHEVEETAKGEVARFRMVQRMADADAVTEGVVRGERMELTMTGAGNPRRAEVAHDPRALGPRRLDRLLREKLRQPGDSVTAVAFFPEKQVSGALTSTLGPEETVVLPEGPRRLHRRTSRAEILPGVDLNEWIDAEGKIWKTSTNLLGMTIETYRSSAEEILSERYATPPEVFLASSVLPDRPLSHPQEAREVVYRFTLHRGDFQSRRIDAMFRGTGQTLLREEAPATRVVRIGTVLPGRAVSRPVKPPAGMEDSMAPNAFIQSDDPRIADLASRVAGAEADAFKAAMLLENWVRNNVKFKDLRIPFASAKEVAQKLEGDCTEHGVLLAAMARAAGIPARVVSGLVYHEEAFVGHMWTEVYIDRWVPLDGTRGKGKVGPDHIALTASPLATSSAADLFFDLAHVIGNLKIEVLDEVVDEK